MIRGLYFTVSTSASTPQAGAAGALWLQKFRDDPYLQGEWRAWPKVEALYEALRSSAWKRQPPAPAPANYSDTYFGNGILQAHAALALTPQIVMDHPNFKWKEPDTVGLGWVRLIGSILQGTTRADDPIQQALDEMLNLEMAQLVQLTPDAQDIIDKFGGFVPDKIRPIPPEYQQKILKTIRANSRCSKTLAGYIDAELGKSP